MERIEISEIKVGDSFNTLLAITMSDDMMWYTKFDFTNARITNITAGNDFMMLTIEWKTLVISKHIETGDDIKRFEAGSQIFNFNRYVLFAE
jgi:hypothetical protein